ncbi:MAG: hypothetical protein Q8Q02_00210 [Nocardioides sp.]|nr:hypothetical protein [Nocardioides sp.]
MGHATERHDTPSYETPAGNWLGFRQPVRRVAMEKFGGTPPDGKNFGDNRDWNPGEVWEETEFWFELS